MVGATKRGASVKVLITIIIVVQQIPEKNIIKIDDSWHRLAKTKCTCTCSVKLGKFSSNEFFTPFLSIFAHFTLNLPNYSDHLSLERSFPIAELGDAKFGQKWWRSEVKQRSTFSWQLQRWYRHQWVKYDTMSKLVHTLNKILQVNC